MTDRSPREWVKLAEYGSTQEAEIAAGRLESEEIPVRIDQHGAPGIFGAGFSGRSVLGVTVYVPGSDLSAARAALDLDFDDPDPLDEAG